MRYRTVLVDDEPLALERLGRLLQPHADIIEVIGTASGGADAVEQIERLKPDLVFLDVQMPELNGFDVLARLQTKPLIIFATAFDEYALRAFEENSVDYLLKPVDPRRLQAAIDKLVRLSDGGGVELRARIERALETMETPRTHRIQVRIGDRMKLIAVAGVLYFRARDKYVEARTAEGTHLLTKSLAQLEKELPPNDFVRVHRSVIVNLDFVDEVAKDEAGGYLLRLKDAKRSELPVSRRYRSRLDLG